MKSKTVEHISTMRTTQSSVHPSQIHNVHKRIFFPLIANNVHKGKFLFVLLMSFRLFLFHPYFTDKMTRGKILPRIRLL